MSGKLRSRTAPAPTMPGKDSSKTTPFHPAFSVSNIKNHVQITLETENVHYASRAELFLNTAQAYDVADRIDPPKDTAIAKDAQWNRLDAIVKQWIYSTISLDLLHTILKPGATAQEAWDRLKDIFNDNKNSRAVSLEQQFSQLHMDNYPNASAYCQALKMLADQLANVGAPVSEERLVLRLVAGLSTGYDSVATFIQQSDPLPPFYKARSMLTLEETRQNRAAAPASDSALLATQIDGTHRSPDSRGSAPSHNNKGRGGRHRSSYRGKNTTRGGNSDSNNRSNFGNKSTGQASNKGSSHPTSWTCIPLTPPPWSQQGWTPPPSKGSQGILGPRPQQAFLAQPSQPGTPQGALVPTDIAAAMQTMTLQQPDDNWYMDTGASSHMTSDQGLADGEETYEAQ